MRKFRMKKWHKHVAAVAAATVAMATIATTKLNPQSPASVQQQIAVSSETKAGPAYLYPDPTLTPGLANPDISQSNISQNICNPQWSTRSIRPPVSYTSQMKTSELASGYTYQGDTNAADYELDHLVSLELGGSPDSQQNLWPEYYNTMVNGQRVGAHEKDSIENLLHKEVCDGTVSLQRGQQIIEQDWYKCYLDSNGGKNENCQ